ncbi:18572_t:CDS:2, partial [Racocetra persica]
IKKLVRLGIPESVRGKAWQFMAGVHKYRKKDVFDKLRDKEKLPIYDDIEKDIDRCYPDHIHFREKGFGQEDLFNILKAYAHYDTVVGYCQGMGRLVGMMLMQMPAEDTFWLLVATIEEYMGGYFAPDLPQIKVDSRIFDLLLFEHDPKLAQHFKNEGVDPILYIPKWFLTLFTMVLPWASVLRVWDVFYFEGVKLFFRIGLAILDCTRDYILSHCPSTSEILEFLGSIPHELLTPDLLLDAAFKIKLKRSTIKRMNKKATEKNSGESDKKLKIDGIEFKLIGDNVNK